LCCPIATRDIQSRSAELVEDEQELFDYIRALTQLRATLEPLRRGALRSLYVSEQQYAYARTTTTQSVVIVINNDKKDAQIEFDVSSAGLRNGNLLLDRLGESKSVVVVNGKMKVNVPARSASIF
jgi:hypothetical protein